VFMFMFMFNPTYIFTFTLALPAYTLSALLLSPLKRTSENSVSTIPGEIDVTRSGVATKS
jgi:hypothetical protein